MRGTSQPLFGQRGRFQARTEGGSENGVPPLRSRPPFRSWKDAMEEKSSACPMSGLDVPLSAFLQETVPMFRDDDLRLLLRLQGELTRRVTVGMGHGRLRPLENVPSDVRIVR